MDVSQLHSLVRKANLTSLQQLLNQPTKKQNQATIINSFFEGRTALHTASYDGRSEVVSLLLEVSSFYSLHPDILLTLSFRRVRKLI